MAFTGRYDHTVDDRGRLALPAKYRHEFADGAFLTPSAEGCVEIYTRQSFDEMSQRVLKEPRTSLRGRRLRRFFFGFSAEVELDGQGRILIPQQLREEAGLDGPVIIHAGSECLEVWNRERYEAEVRQVREAYAAELESLG